MGLDPALRDAALRWIADDPDPDTRTALQTLLAAAMTGADSTALADALSGPLRFGTAGLRGAVRAGPAGMNVAVVRRATAGLAAWLVERGARGRAVVVGRDARHGSEAFARETAGVLAAAGFVVHVLPGPTPTPLLAFAVQQRGAAAGVQITASHNPPQDNGYKVYLGAAVSDAPGAQLTTPADAEIEAAVAAAPAAVAIPADGPTTVDDVTAEYLDRVAGLGTAATGLRIALTPMHGVGGATAVHALARSGFTDVHVVAEQATPDPDFPTVDLPNPEEPGATDLLLALAARTGADLAVALDPDADRCALGVPTPTGWRMLTGDETGVLLGDHLLRRRSGLVATTVVSSSMLAKVAAAHGAPSAETLTGFKWIVRAGPGLVYGYEEALGYCVDPEAVRDKDGIAAAVVAADLAAGLKAAGRTLLDRLDELSRAHGVHRTVGISVRMPPTERDAVVARLGGAPPEGWSADRPAPDVLRLRGDGLRVVVRPSGTEPKLKAYLEVVEPPTDDLEGARARADERMAALREEITALIG
ncbi:phospho-sugar mutase [Pseudonocardia kujensis]|uniref:phospho-sugar mutase n=1 Tax=Pseudonocardia kujensis TaxID=1128675 RepID=UPI001E3C8F0D|nr:phospho-sugar mutase [Pseudonocardia kujensis]MCE0766693.1 phospho-sugar mutase [Pseudonocardia kujensis]